MSTIQTAKQHIREILAKGIAYSPIRVERYPHDTAEPLDEIRVILHDASREHVSIRVRPKDVTHVVVVSHGASYRLTLTEEEKHTLRAFALSVAGETE